MDQAPSIEDLFNELAQDEQTEAVSLGVDDLSMNFSRTQHEENPAVANLDPTFTENDRFGLVENDLPEMTDDQLENDNACFVPGVGRMSKKSYVTLMEKRRAGAAAQEGSSGSKGSAKKRAGHSPTPEQHNTETPTTKRARSKTRKAGKNQMETHPMTTRSRSRRRTTRTPVTRPAPRSRSGSKRRGSSRTPKRSTQRKQRNQTAVHPETSTASRSRSRSKRRGSSRSPKRSTTTKQRNRRRAPGK